MLTSEGGTLWTKQDWQQQFALVRDTNLKFPPKTCVHLLMITSVTDMTQISLLFSSEHFQFTEPTFKPNVLEGYQENDVLSQKKNRFIIVAFLW